MIEPGARRLVLATLALAAIGGLALGQEGDERVLGGERRTLRVELRTRSSLTQKGVAIPDARLAWVGDGESPVDAALRATRTDGEGRAELPVPEDGGVLLVWKPGFAPTAHWFTRGGDRQLAAAPAIPVVGRVVGPSGDPVEGAAVTVDVEVPVVGGEGELRVHRYAQTVAAGQGGRFEFADAPHAPVGLRADAAGWVSGERYPVSPGEADVEIVLGRGATVTGSVSLLPGGGPAAGVVVAIAGREGTVREDGTFVVDTVPQGMHELFVEGSGFVPPAPRRLVLKEGQQRGPIVIELLAGATFEGSLHDERGAVVAAAGLRFVYPPLADGAAGPFDEEAVGELLREVETDAAGRFRVADLFPAEGVTLEVRTETYVPLRVEGLALRPGEVSRPAQLVVSAGGVLRGRVVDGAARGVPGAEVAAFVDGDASPEPVRVAIADDDGGFDLRGVPGRAILIEVAPAAGGFELAAQFGPFDARDDELVDVGTLELAQGHVLRGRVEGAPPGVAVRAFSGEDLVAEAALVEGTFELRGLVPGQVTVEATASGADGLAVANALVPSDGALFLTWLDAKPVLCFLRDETGSAVPEAHVVVEAVVDDGEEERSEPDAPVELPREVDVRDAEGRFDLRLLPGRWRITAATADGRFGSTEVVLGRYAEGEQVTIDVLAGEPVQGHVVDADTGAPLEGAVVRAIRVAGAADAASPQGVADERGFFRVPGVRPGMIRLRIDAAGYAPHETPPLSVRRAAAPYVGRIEVRPGVRVLGRITDRDLPVPGATVVLEDDDGYRRSARTDLHGRYEITGMSVGSVVLWVQTPDDAPQRAMRVLVRMRSEGFRLDADLASGTRLAGRVTSRGRPEPHATVSAWTFGADPAAAQVRTDAHGRFALPPLPPGPARVSVQPAGGRVAHEYDVNLPDAYDERVELELPDAAVAGQVVAEQGGSAVAGAFVRLVTRTDGDSRPRVAGDAVTDPHGRFHIARVEPGEYVLEASRTGFGVAALERIEVRANDVLDGLFVQMPEEAAVEVRVIDRRGHAVPGASLTASRPLPDGGETRRRAAADGRGNVRLGGLAPGDWEFRVDAPGFARHHGASTRVYAGDNRLEDVVLELGALLRVRVVGGFLEPVPGAVVHIEDPFGADPRAGRRPDQRLRGADRAYVSDSHGDVLIDSLAPGAYRVWVEGTHEDEVLAVQVSDSEARTVYLFGP